MTSSQYLPMAAVPCACVLAAGTSNPKLLDRAVQVSLETSGCIKIDLKAYEAVLHTVLAGGLNRRTLETLLARRDELWSATSRPWSSRARCSYPVT